MIHQRAKFHHIPPTSSPTNARKPQIWPLSPSPNGIKVNKISRLWPKSNTFWRWSTCQSLVHSFHALSRKCLETANLTCFTMSKWHQNEQTNRPWPKADTCGRSWGYISMPNFRPLLPCFLKKIPRNCKFDLFPWVQMPLKWIRSADRDQNLICYECGQDTSACKIVGHSSDCNKNSDREFIFTATANTK